MTLQSLIAKLAGVVGSRFLGAGIGFLSQIVLARILPVEEVGIVFLAMSAAAFISLAAVGGYSMLATTQLPRLSLHRRKISVAAFHSLALRDGLVAGIAIAVLLWLFSYALNFSNGQNLALALGFVCAPASALMRYDSAVASAARQFAIGYLPDFLFRPSLLLLGILALYSVGVHISVQHVLVIFTVSIFITAIGQHLLLMRKGIAYSQLKKPRRSFTRVLRSRALALTLVAAMAFAFADLVTLASGLLLPEKDVAIVGVAMRLAAIAGFVLQAGQAFVLTDFTQALMKGDDRMANILLLRINLTTLSVVGAAVLGAFIFGGFALSLFGQQYIGGAGLLLLLMMGQSVRALGGMNQHILSINGHQMRTAGACIIALIIFALSAIILSRTHGFMGIGYAVVLTELAWLLALAAQAQKLCGRRGDLLWLSMNRLKATNN